jgi:hypothetical protein
MQNMLPNEQHEQIEEYARHWNMQKVNNQCAGMGSHLCANDHAWKRETGGRIECWGDDEMADGGGPYAIRWRDAR